jgi:hypothetical protein
VATAAFGPHMGSPSSAFSATFKSVRKMAMPLVTSDRVMPRLGPALLVVAVCTALAAVVEEAGVDGAPPRLDAGCENDEAWWGVGRVGAARLWKLLECAGEGGSFFFFSFLDNLLKNKDEEDMVNAVKYNAQIVS